MSSFSLEYFCEPLMEDPSYFSKKMFGGLSIYYNDLMIFVLAESPGDRQWKEQTYDFDLWNGVLVCTSREHHPALLAEFQNLTSHPVLGKWLYLPMSDAKFESTFELLVSGAKRGDPRIGIVPGQKKSGNKKKSLKKKNLKKKNRDKKA